MDARPVYVVEDNALARRTLLRQLRLADRESVAYETAVAFLEDFPTLAPGIVLLDIHLPDISGIDLLRKSDLAAAPFAVVIISGSDQMDDVIAAFRHGAIHFLRKPYRFVELARVLDEASKVVEARLIAQARQAKAATVHLSRREREILQALAAGKQSKAIAFELGVSIRTVEMHRSNIIAKLGARSAAHALVLAQELGLL